MASVERRLIARVPRPPRFVAALLDAGGRIVSDHSDRTLAGAAIAIFFILWLTFDLVAFAPTDVHPDVSEATLWAQTFAFGYKHPPLTAWLQGLWFAVLPRQNWAAYLLAVVTATSTLAVAWPLLRDHLDKNKALFGLAALTTIPLYSLKAPIFNANTVPMPFWAAALLFYLRARRGLGLADACLAGAFAGLTVLGKYWGVFLWAGMAAAAICGPDVRRFWRAPAPYVMALAAAVVVAPHVAWLITEQGGAAYAFMHRSVVSDASFAGALGKSAYYGLGAIAYVTGPLLFLAVLKPSRAALADIVWPAEDTRRQALVLLIVPLVLPALVNLASPYRLTSDWTYPNWALLPVVLYATPLIKIDERVVAGGGLFALALPVLAVLVSPIVAYQHLARDHNPNRLYFHQIAALADAAVDQSIQTFWGTPDVADGLPFYTRRARPLKIDPLSPEGRVAIDTSGLFVVCASDDDWCRATSRALVQAGARTTSTTLRRTFLGWSSKPATFEITMLPPEPQASAASRRGDGERFAATQHPETKPR